MVLRRSLNRDFIVPVRRAILSCGFERQHKIATNYYNYVDLTGKIEIWEEFSTPGIRILLKETLTLDEDLKNMGLYLRASDWKPQPFCSKAGKPVVLSDLSTIQFLTITRLMPIAKLLSKEIKRRLH